MFRLAALTVRRRHVRSLSTINPAEIEFFSKLSSQWWDERGEFAFLHRMNPARVGYIRDKIAQVMDEKATAIGNDMTPSVAKAGRLLEGLNVLDVGCGGGLLSESLARLGASTLGVDASESNINIATLHASADPKLKSRLEYQHTSAEDLVESGRQFDVVCSMEVIEHVDNPSAFLKSCASLVKPGGHLFLSTISRTPLSYLLTIFMAEHALGLVRQGTHTYSKFVNPSELIEFFHDEEKWISRTFDGKPTRKEAEVRSIIYSPLRRRWDVLSEGEGLEMARCNYLFWARKPLI